MTEVDEGDLCWICGTAIAVFCEVDREALIFRYCQGTATVRSKVDLVRAGVRAAAYSKCKEQRATSSTAISIEVYIEVALISIVVFEVHLSVAGAAAATSAVPVVAGVMGQLSTWQPQWQL